MAYTTAKEYRAAAERQMRVALEDEVFGCDAMMRIHLKMATLLEAKAIALEHPYK